MRVIETVRELQALADAERAAGQRLALVPTMGALHAGHLALLDAARKRADRVWLSIFVNPAQFDEAADFERYPRRLEGDLARCRDAGVDLVFAPAASQLYPPGHQSWVEVTELSRPLCGAGRPGHFRGVASVVARLLLAAKPHCAVFGEKDFQQLAVIRRMVRDLGFDVEIVGVPIVREPDGLALSSRNRLLSPAARVEAQALVRALDAAEQALGEGEQGRDRLLEIVQRELARAPRARVDYAEFRDPDTLELASPRLESATLLALAVRFRADPAAGDDAVRLIDNRVLRPALAPEEPT